MAALQPCLDGASWASGSARFRINPAPTPHDDVLRHQRNRHGLNFFNPHLATNRLGIFRSCIGRENPPSIAFRSRDPVENRLSQAAQLFDFFKLNTRRCRA